MIINDFASNVHKCWTSMTWAFFLWEDDGFGYRLESQTSPLRRFFCVLWKIASLRDVKSRPEGGCQMESCGFSKFFWNFRWIFSELVQWFYLKRIFPTIELSNELFLLSSLLWFVMCFSGSHGSRVSSGMVYKISIEKRSSWLSCGAETRWVAIYETSLETLRKRVWTRCEKNRDGVFAQTRNSRKTWKDLHFYSDTGWWGRRLSRVECSHFTSFRWHIKAIRKESDDVVKNGFLWKFSLHFRSMVHVKGLN